MANIELNVDPYKVAGVVKEVSQILASKGFSRLDLIIGLAEVTGRVIVDASETQIQAKELSAVAFGHLSQTITVGLAQTQGQSRIARL